MGLSSLLTRLLKRKRKVRRFGPSLISLDNNPIPVGLYKTFTAGASITAGQVVSLHTNGMVYPASPSYPNVVGVAIDSVSAGASVRVLVVGVAQVVADGAINPGQPVTFSSATAGRVVAYGGHSHGVSTTTGTFVTGVSTYTGTFVTGISTSTGSALTGIGSDTGWYRDASGYARHTHSTSTGTFLTGATPSTGSAVTSVSTSTGTALTSVSVQSSLNRVIGIALTGATAAGQTVTILVIPTWL
jgi:hypothetical protein